VRGARQPPAPPRPPRWWISFWQPGADVADEWPPLGNGLLGCWDSGQRGSEDAGDLGLSVCILVEAATETDARAIANRAFPKFDGYEARFFEARDRGWTPGDRFPLAPAPAASPATEEDDDV
jgi:hypothetical protein